MAELSLNDIALNKREGNVRVWKMYDEAADFKIRLSDFERALASLETSTSGEEMPQLLVCLSRKRRFDGGVKVSIIVSSVPGDGDSCKFKLWSGNCN